MKRVFDNLNLFLKSPTVCSYKESLRKAVWVTPMVIDLEVEDTRSGPGEGNENSVNDANGSFFDPSS